MSVYRSEDLRLITNPRGDARVARWSFRVILRRITGSRRACKNISRARGDIYNDPSQRILHFLNVRFHLLLWEQCHRNLVLGTTLGNASAYFWGS
jgi:hypothetical protein